MALLGERHAILRGHHVPKPLHSAAQGLQFLVHPRARLPARLPAGDLAPRHPEQPGQLLLSQGPLGRRGQGILCAGGTRHERGYPPGRPLHAGVFFGDLVEGGGKHREDDLAAQRRRWGENRLVSLPLGPLGDACLGTRPTMTIYLSTLL